MKKLLAFIWAMATFSDWMPAQVCGPAVSKIDIQPNTIKARIRNDGRLFTGDPAPHFFPNPDPNAINNPSTIFDAAIWMAGLDSGGKARIVFAGQSAGPLNAAVSTDSMTCTHWDRAFRIKAQEIQQFRAALPMDAATLKAQFPSIAGWPGNSNPYFFAIYGFDLPTGMPLAPFHDNDQDGKYDPLKGDYPVVQLQGLQEFVPTEMVWLVFNDIGNGLVGSALNPPIGLETQMTVWGFSDPDHPEINRTLFTSHKILYKGQETLDSTFLAVWADVDIGCSEDDYAGCNPALNCMYGYNADAVDGGTNTACFQALNFKYTPPVQSITLLNLPLNKFLVYSNSGGTNTGDPTNIQEFYNCICGRWKDGAPLTYGHTGSGGAVHTNFLFPDDPVDPNGWSMCTANIPVKDRRLLGSVKVGKLQPGWMEEVNVAWAYHPDPSLPCGLGNTFNDVTLIKKAYNNSFEDQKLGVKENMNISCKLFPNPASNSFTLQLDQLHVQNILIFDAAGRMVLAQDTGFDTGTALVSTASLPNGWYTVRLICEEGSAVNKLCVLH